MINKQNLLNHAKFSRDFILDLIFPIECLGCGKEGVWLCKTCFRLLPQNLQQYCLGCKKPQTFGQFCSNCSPAFFLTGIFIASNYDNPLISSLIKNLKYHFAKDLSKILGEFLSLFLDNLIKKSRMNAGILNLGVDHGRLEKIKTVPEIILDFKSSLLIPVPLSKKRERWRGFNQTAAISKTVAEFFSLQISNDLIRVVHKTPQAKLKERERRENIHNCFKWCGESLAGRRVILIDDVVTTGSTLDECAKVLKQAGAQEVWGAVIAKG